MKNKIPFKMSALNALVLLSLLGGIIGFCNGCSSSSDQKDTASDLQAMLEEKWDAYSAPYPNLPGGMSFMVISGEDRYFASYKMGEDMTVNSRLRAASITKTFTATAILLLEQGGLLDIENTIVSAIHGSDEPYLPDTPDYDIPYKERITIKQLLSTVPGYLTSTTAISLLT